MEDDKPVREAFADVKEYRRAYDRWRDKNKPNRRDRNRDPERLAQHREWYAANRKAVLEQKKDYFQKNKEKLREPKRIWAKKRYHADPEFRAESIKRARASALANPERVRALATQRYHASPDLRAKVKQRNIDYMAGNAEKIAEQRAKFREENRALLAERQRQWVIENMDEITVLNSSSRRDYAVRAILNGWLVSMSTARNITKTISTNSSRTTRSAKSGFSAQLHLG
jgi:hypothetical protein